MAVRTSASTQNHYATLLLGSQTKASMTCWVKITTDTNTNTCAWLLTNTAGTSYIALMTNTDGTTMLAWDSGSATITGPNMTVGTWYFFGFSWNASALILTYQTLGASAFTTTSNSLGGASHTFDKLTISNSVEGNAGGAFLNGCIAAVKGWVGTTLTEAQLQSEAWSYAPKNPSPTFWYPFLKPEMTDYSGNGRTLSGGSGATTEDGPGIGWSQRGPRAPIKDTIEVVLGQATSIETAGVIHVQRGVGKAIETNAARSTKIEVVVDAATQINTAVEIVDPIAIGVTALTASSAAASAQSWATASVIPTGNRLVLACFAWAASTAVVASPIASVTGNGLTWVLLSGQNYGAATGTIDARHRMEVWRALGPAPTAGVITVTHAAAQPGINRCWSVFEVNSTDLSGTSGSGAIRQSAVNRGTLVTTATATLGAFGSTANATFGFGAGASAMTVGTGFTAIATQIVTTPTPAVSLITEWFLGVDTTVNANQTSSGQFGIIGFEIKRRFVEPLTGPPFETDLAQAITRRKTQTLGMATETDASRAIVGFKVKAIGQTVQTNAAQIVTGVKVRALGMATATHTAQALARIKTAAVAQIIGAQTAQALAKLKLKAIGQTTETETAQALGRVRSRVVSQSTETGQARALSVAKLKVVAQATSTMAAQVVTAVRIRAIGLATEAEAARAMGTPLKSRVLGLVTGTNAAQALTHLKLRLLGQAITVDLAQTVTRVKMRAVGQVLSSNAATALAKTKALLVDRAGDTSAAQVVTAVYVRAIGMATSTHVAQAVSRLKTLVIGQVVGFSSSLAIAGRKTLALAQAVSTGAARLVGRGRGIAQVVEASAARALVALKVKTIALAAETGAASVLVTLKRLALGTAVGTELARLVGVERGLIQVVEPNLARDAVSRPTLSAAVGKVAEVETASPVAFTFTQVVAVGQVTLTNVAPGLASLRRYPVTKAAESNDALTISRLLVHQATETSTALTISTTGMQVGTIVLLGSGTTSTLSGSGDTISAVGSSTDIALTGHVDYVPLEGS
jgi:hypothetical protein